jgi:predicted aspartyl protease
MELNTAGGRAVVWAGLVVLMGCEAVERPDRVGIGPAAEEAREVGAVGEAGEVVRLAAETSAALELAGPGGAALLVPVYVNGSGPHGFILDTGATMTCVDASLAERLELPEARGRLEVGMGIGQEPGALALVRLDSVRVGGATAEGLTGCALDLGRFRAMGLEAEGLLGLNFLREFRVTLDFAADRVWLER